MDRSTSKTVERLYAAHSAEALRVAFSLVDDRASAEDLVHEAFVRVMGRFGDLRERTAFRSYLLRAVVNLSHSHFRKLRSQRNYVARQQASSIEATPSSSSVEDSDALVRALRLLPFRQRDAVVLRYCHDLPETDVAAIMSTSPKAVRSLVGRGLERLRKEVER